MNLFSHTFALNKRLYSLVLFTVFLIHNTNGQLLTKGNTYAVIVGISDYQDSNIKDLSYAHKDAEAFADYLTSNSGGSVPSENIKLLINEDATISNIYTAVRTIQNKIKPKDLIYFYFSGHGDVEEGLYKLGFLLAYDTPHKNYLTNAIRIEDINMMANTLSIQKDVKVVLITDACHSGKLVRDNKGSILVGEQLSKVQKNEIRLASCEAEQLSQEGPAWGGGRGAFSFYLINGLTGFADTKDDEEEADGVVTVAELKRYLEKKVPRDVQKLKNEEQIPVVEGKSYTPMSLVDTELIASIKDEAGADDSNVVSRSIQYTPPPSDVYFKNLSKVSILEKADWREWKDMSHKKIVKAAISRFAFCENDDIKKSSWRKKLPKSKDLRNEYGLSLASVIHTNAQQIINKYMVFDTTIVSENAEDPKLYAELDICSDMLSTGIKLVPEEDRLYNILKLKSHYVKGLSARLQLPFSSNPDSLINVAKEEFEKAIAIEDKASYVKQEMSYVTSYQVTTGAKKVKRRTVVRRNTTTTRTIRSGENK